MSKAFYIGSSNGVARKGKKIYVSKNGVAKKAEKAYIGVPTGIELRETPNGYTQLEYIEFGEEAYIDTRYKPNMDTRALIDIELTNLGSNSIAVFGARVAKNLEGFAVYPRNDVIYFDYANDQATPTNLNTNQRVIVDLNKNNMSYGSTSHSFTYGPITCPYGAFLGSVNDGGQPYSKKSTGKLYSCKIWNNDILVRDYIPVKSPNGIVGMYDFISKTLYAASNGENFIAGPVAKACVARLFYQGTQLGSISVSTSSMSFSGKGSSKTATITYVGNGTITAVTSNSNVATASVSNNIVTVTSKGGGDAVITIRISGTDDYTASTCEISVKVAFTLGYHGAITNLSDDGRYSMATATVGNYAIFAGGAGYSPNSYSPFVDAYNTSLTKSTPTALERGLQGASGVSIGNYAAIVGGSVASSTYVLSIEAYNKSLTRTITNNALSHGGIGPSGVTVGDYGIFHLYALSATDVIEAINSSLTVISAPSLSLGRSYPTLAKAGNYAVVAGGAYRDATVEAYSSSLTKVSSVTSLSQFRDSIGSTTINKYALLVGGRTGQYYGDEVATADAYNSSLTRTTPTTLSVATDDANGTTVGNYAIFAIGELYDAEAMEATDNNLFNVYNTSLTRTSSFNQSGYTRRCWVNAITIGNYGLFAGGYTHETAPRIKADVNAFAYS